MMPSYGFMGASVVVATLLALAMLPSLTMVDGAKTGLRMNASVAVFDPAQDKKDKTAERLALRDFHQKLFPSYAEWDFSDDEVDFCQWKQTVTCADNIRVSGLQLQNRGGNQGVAPSYCTPPCLQQL